jgi:hypothetical protein
MDKFKFLFKVVMACLYMILGVYVSIAKMGGGPLSNTNLRIAFAIVLIVYGMFRAYNLSKEYQEHKNNKS